MRIYTIFSVYGILFLFSVLLFLFQCKDKKDTRRNFQWFGTVNGVEATYIVRCDNECVSCTAYVGGGDFEVLPKSSTAYAKCQELPKSTDISDYIDTITNLLVEFIEDTISDSVYGFDSWRKKDGSSYSKRVSYISLKAGGSTRFKVRVNTGQGAFDSYILSVEGNFLHLSFDSLSEFVTTYQLYPGVNPITIYSHSEFSEGETGFSVIASSRHGDICLAGDCETSEDSLVCVVYKPVKHTNFAYHYSSFTDDTTIWRHNFDSILKQGVVFLDTVELVNIDSVDWDVNNNNYFDLFNEMDTVYFEKFDEFFNVVEITDDEINESYKNTRCASFLINTNTFLRHYPLSGQFVNDDNGFTVIPSDYCDLFEVGDELYISPYFRPYEYELIKIKYFGIGNFTVCLANDPTQGLPPDIWDVDQDTVTLFKIWSINGKCILNTRCSIMKESANYDTYVHEFLHSEKVGFLKHVGDEYDSTCEIDNIMYPFDDRTGVRLRYRDLPMYEEYGYYSQWEWLHGKF